MKVKRTPNKAIAVRDHYKQDAYINFHLPVQAIVEQQVMRHTYAVRLHRMSLAIVVIANITYKVHKYITISLTK